MMDAQNTPGLLFVATNIEPAHEAAVNRWYDERHVPQRRALPGFRSAQRYIACEGGPQYAALYELDTPGALQTDAYRSLSRPPEQTNEDREMLKRFVDPVRGVLVQIHGAGATGVSSHKEPALLIVGLEPEPAYDEEFNAWYNEEHIPKLTSVPGVLGVRRFKAIEGVPAYLAVWELEKPEVRQSTKYREMADTAWTKRIRAHATRRVDAVYRPLVPPR